MHLVVDIVAVDQRMNMSALLRNIMDVRSDSLRHHFRNLAEIQRRLQAASDPAQLFRD